MRTKIHEVISVSVHKLAIISVHKIAIISIYKIVRAWRNLNAYYHTIRSL